jgi:hypothetical protein
MPIVPAVADRQALILSGDPPRRFKARAAGLFLFVLLLARMGFDSLVRDSGYPGTKMIPADAALLSLLAMKLLRKERQSHIDDFNVDEGLGLFAGLNVLPKKSFATDYSYRTQRRQQEMLLGSWVKKTDPAARGQVLLAGFSSDSLSRRGGPAGESLHPLSRPGVSQRADLLRSSA